MTCRTSQTFFEACEIYNPVSIIFKRFDSISSRRRKVDNIERKISYLEVESLLSKDRSISKYDVVLLLLVVSLISSSLR